MGDCVFCDKRALNNPDIFEIDGVENFFYFWDINPVTPGHLLIIPKRHVADFKNLNRSETSELAMAILKSYEKIESTDIARLYEEVLFDIAPEGSRQFLRKSIEKINRFNRKPDAYNHGVNDGMAAGRTINHFHYHIFPRWRGDTGEARGGVRHFIEGMGSYKI